MIYSTTRLSLSHTLSLSLTHTLSHTHTHTLSRTRRHSHSFSLTLNLSHTLSLPHNLIYPTGYLLSKAATPGVSQPLLGLSEIGANVPRPPGTYKSNSALKCILVQHKLFNPFYSLFNFD